MTEDEIFFEARAIPDPETRRAWLQRVCGEQSCVRQNVESLLRHDALAGNFLNQPPEEVGAVLTSEPGLDTTGQLALGLGPAIAQSFRHWRRSLPDLAPPSETPGCLGCLGDYEILGVHGRGGMGIVYRARDPKLDRLVAIKLMSPALAASPAARERFLREARAVAVVRHRNVVAVHQVDDRDPLPFLVMELIEGVSLQQRIADSGPLSLTETVRIGARIADGLGAIHASGLVHCDIKPANILLDGPDQEVKIADFGLATAASSADESAGSSGGSSDASRREPDAQIIGTPRYMSPEHARGQACDHRSDLYGLGLVLVAMCTGRPPQTDHSPFAQSADGRHLSARTLSGKAPEWLCELIGKLLDPDPGRRPQSAVEVAGFLRQQLRVPESPVSVQDHTEATRRKVPPTGRRRWIGLTALSGLILSGILIIITNRSGKTTRLEVPDDATVRVTDDGQVEVVLPATLKSSGRKSTVTDGSRDTSEPVASPQEVTSIPDESEKDRRAREWKQVLGDRLRHRNPEFDGSMELTFEADALTGIRLRADGLRDLSPLAELTGLTRLICEGTDTQQPAPLTDLKAISTLRLREFSCAVTSVTDLSPLAAMPLEILNLAGTRVSDLSPVAGMKLRVLGIQSTQISDLTVLRDMPLTSLNISHTPVTDLSPLRGSLLEGLYLDGTRIPDLTPLQGMPLRSLNLRGYDLSDPAFGEIIRTVTTLENINSEPVSGFAGGGTSTPR